MHLRKPKSEDQDLNFNFVCKNCRQIGRMCQDCLEDLKVTLLPYVQNGVFQTTALRWAPFVIDWTNSKFDQELFRKVKKVVKFRVKVRPHILKLHWSVLSTRACHHCASQNVGEVCLHTSMVVFCLQYFFFSLWVTSFMLSWRHGFNGWFHLRLS